MLKFNIGIQENMFYLQMLHIQKIILIANLTTFSESRRISVFRRVALVRSGEYFIVITLVFFVFVVVHVLSARRDIRRLLACEPLPETVRKPSLFMSQFL